MTIIAPGALPALPLEARTLKEPDGRAGALSFLVLLAVSTVLAVAGALWLRTRLANGAEILAVMIAVGFAYLVALANRYLRLGLLSRLAEQVVVVLIPPLALIFLVLGTIFIGVATPTEGGAMGATGALILALAKRRLTLDLLQQAMRSTAKLSAFVVFILVGARVFSLTFYGVDGHRWVEHLLTSLPGGQVGFLIVVNALIFFLAFFLDFFELAFIVIPLIGPAAEKIGIDLIWLGVMLGVNMQTSFMHPPFGFALFYLRSRGAEGALPRPRHQAPDGPGHDRPDLLGCRPLRRHPGRDGGARHPLPGDGHGLRGHRRQGRPELDQAARHPADRRPAARSRPAAGLDSGPPPGLAPPASPQGSENGVTRRAGRVRLRRLGVDRGATGDERMARYGPTRSSSSGRS